MEIDLELKDELARHVLSRDQYTELRDYYVLCGVYAELGKPYLRENPATVELANFTDSKTDG